MDRKSRGDYKMNYYKIKQLTQEEQDDFKKEFPRAEPKEYQVFWNGIAYHFYRTEGEAKAAVDYLKRIDILSDKAGELIDELKEYAEQLRLGYAEVKEAIELIL